MAAKKTTITTRKPRKAPVKPKRTFVSFLQQHKRLLLLVAAVLLLTFFLLRGPYIKYRVEALNRERKDSLQVIEQRKHNLDSLLQLYKSAVADSLLEQASNKATHDRIVAEVEGERKRTTIQKITNEITRELQTPGLSDSARDRITDELFRSRARIKRSTEMPSPE